MYCQKCRTPLKLDSSLENLNPAAFDLLIGSTGKSLPDSPSNLAPPAAPSASQRRDLYNQASKHATSPVYKRTVPAPRHGAQNSGQPRTGPRDGPGMSFVMLNESQVPVMQPAYHAHDDNRRGSGAKLESIQDEQGQEGEDAALSDQVERTTRLFEMISARSDIDHPICTECTDLLVDGLQKRLLAATKERDAYISFLKNLNASIPSTEEVKAAEESLEATLKAEADAFQELQSLEQEKLAVDKEITELEEESRQLDREEEQFWRDRNDFALTLSEFQDERDALNMKFDHDSHQLERLQRTNVYNDTFCIGHDGYFGTINGLRLGRLSNPSVEWAEINAAWGQTLLLLATVSEKLGFQFQGYKLRPMGSTSQIEKIEYPQQSPSQTNTQTAATPSDRRTNDPTTPAAQQSPQAAALPPKVSSLDLFSTGDLPLNLPWLHRRFDAGMVAFLECLRQLGMHVEKTTTSATPTPSNPSPSPSRRSPSQADQVRSPRSGGQQPQKQQQQQVVGLKLPYEIKRDKIGDASIKLGFNQNDETWTRACKYTLTCCKFLLAHASNVAGGRGGSPAPAGGSRER